MRWKPQVDDEANKGLHILKDLMLPVAKVSNIASHRDARGPQSRRFHWIF
jgi:hypothetical protein